jgi:uncharacterized protein (TIGR00730 family)
MVVTGAGAGIMGAAQEGAGGETSFGLNIRLPFEQEANPWIASDPKLITFKYFFTRKLFLVKEASGVALFPGGYGTMDETFELLTLMQTGKSALVPVVLVEAGPKPYWRIWHRWIAGTLVERGLIDAEDTSLFRIVDTPDEAVAEITGFYRVYQSARIVGDDLVFRLNRPIQPTQVTDIQDKFADILKGRPRLAPGPIPQELNEFPQLSRLITAASCGRPCAVARAWRDRTSSSRIGSSRTTSHRGPTCCSPTRRSSVSASTRSRPAWSVTRASTPTSTSVIASWPRSTVSGAAARGSAARCYSGSGRS